MHAGSSTNTKAAWSSGRLPRRARRARASSPCRGVGRSTYRVVQLVAPLVQLLDNGVPPPRPSRTGVASPPRMPQFVGPRRPVRSCARCCALTSSSARRYILRGLALRRRDARVGRLASSVDGLQDQVGRRDVAASSPSVDAERTEPSSFGADPASPSFHADHESAELSSLAPFDHVAHAWTFSDRDWESVLQSPTKAQLGRAGVLAKSMRPPAVLSATRCAQD